MSLSIALAERGLVPEPLLRAGIRNLLGRRLREESLRYRDLEAGKRRWLDEMARSAIAPEADSANQQHYEVPAEFYQLTLGAQLKYSSAYWPEGVDTLDDAEEAMLALTAQHAELRDGQRILELGCGWGSLTLWMARNFPAASIVAVSNSHSQRKHIEGRLRELRLDSVDVLTRDVNALQLPGRGFDRVVSVEMFEHLRNWPEVLRRVHGWLKEDGKLFTHVFAHRLYAYPFETSASDDWMGRHFFTGGMMPSADLFERIQSPFVVQARHDLPGTHYARTAEAWRDNLVDNQEAVIELFAREEPVAHARTRYERWKMFFLSCAELFAFRGGSEWLVTHNLLAPKGSRP
jgi:cyclopropane-fatty-acyl-phospholipid synthase